MRALQDAERGQPRGGEASAGHLRARSRQPAAPPQMRQGGPTPRDDPNTIGLAATPPSNRRTEHTVGTRRVAIRLVSAVPLRPKRSGGKREGSRRRGSDSDAGMQCPRAPRRLQLRDRSKMAPERGTVITTPPCNDGGPASESLRRATHYTLDYLREGSKPAGRDAARLGQREPTAAIAARAYANGRRSGE